MSIHLWSYDVVYLGGGAAGLMCACRSLRALVLSRRLRCVRSIARKFAASKKMRSTVGGSRSMAMFDEGSAYVSERMSILESHLPGRYALNGLQQGIF